MMVKISLSEIDFKRLEKAVQDSMELSEKIACATGRREDWDEAHEWLNLYKKLKQSVQIDPSSSIVETA